MGVDATWPLQQGLLKYLEQDLSLKKHLGKNVKIFDQNEIPGKNSQSSDKAGFPKVILGDNFSKAWSSATFEGQEHDLTLHLWTNEGGSPASKKIAGVIIDRLHNADFPVPGHALVDLQFASSETRYREDLGRFHCRLQFKALTVSD